MTAVQTRKFTPRRQKGVAVPGRFSISQRFSLSGSVALLPMYAAVQMTDRIRHTFTGGPPYLFEPCLEHEVDGGALQAIKLDLPSSPKADRPAATSSRIILSFYVDEHGNARLPNVDSSAPPELIIVVVEAVMKWKFAPPRVNGRPALVFAMRSVQL
jgi:hypothetical protein